MKVLPMLLIFLFAVAAQAVPATQPANAAYKTVFTKKLGDGRSIEDRRRPISVAEAIAEMGEMGPHLTATDYSSAWSDEIVLVDKSGERTLCSFPGIQPKDFDQHPGPLANPPSVEDATFGDDRLIYLWRSGGDISVVVVRPGPTTKPVSIDQASLLHESDAEGPLISKCSILGTVRGNDLRVELTDSLASKTYTFKYSDEKGSVKWVEAEKGK